MIYKFEITSLVTFTENLVNFLSDPNMDNNFLGQIKSPTQIKNKSKFYISKFQNQFECLYFYKNSKIFDRDDKFPRS